MGNQESVEEEAPLSCTAQKEALQQYVLADVLCCSKRRSPNNKYGLGLQMIDKGRIVDINTAASETAPRLGSAAAALPSGSGSANWLLSAEPASEPAS